MSAPAKLRVAIDAGPLTLVPAGVGRYIIELTAALARGDEVSPVVVGPDAPALRRFSAADRIPTGAVVGSFAARARRHAFETQRLPGELRAKGVRLFHATAFRIPHGDPGVPVVVTVPDLASFLLPATQGAVRAASRRLQIGRSVRHAVRIIVLSEAVRAELLRRFPAADAKTRVVPLGVGPPFREGVRIEPTHPVFVSVATLERRKNLSGLLRAFARVLPRHPAARLRLIGQPGNDLGRIRANLASLGLADNVTIEGRLADLDVAAAYRGATAVVYPSLDEGFGLPILEAMACGIPVVASTADALREVGGDAVLYAPPRDPGELSRQIERALDDEPLRERSLVAGPDRAAAFSWETAAAKTAEAVREAAESAGANA